MRDEYLGDPERRRDEEFKPGTKIIKAISRSTPVAPVDPWINFATDAKYQSSVAQQMLGPILGKVANAIQSQVRVWNKDEEGDSPSLERARAKHVYDLLVEPVVNIALTAAPLTPYTTIAAGALTQVVGGLPVAGKQMRGRFVDAIAGEKDDD